MAFSGTEQILFQDKEYGSTDIIPGDNPLGIRFCEIDLNRTILDTLSPFDKNDPRIIREQYINLPIDYYYQGSWFKTKRLKIEGLHALNLSNSDLAARLIGNRFFFSRKVSIGGTHGLAIDHEIPDIVTQLESKGVKLLQEASIENTYENIMLTAQKPVGINRAAGVLLAGRAVETGHKSYPDFIQQAFESYPEDLTPNRLWKGLIDLVSEDWADSVNSLNLIPNEEEARSRYFLAVSDWIADLTIRETFTNKVREVEPFPTDINSMPRKEFVTYIPLVFLKFLLKLPENLPDGKFYNWTILRTMHNRMTEGIAEMAKYHGVNQIPEEVDKINKYLTNIYQVMLLYQNNPELLNKIGNSSDDRTEARTEKIQKALAQIEGFKAALRSK